MAETYCSPIFGYADAIVTDGWVKFQGFAQNAYELAIEQLEALQNFEVPDVPISLTYDFSDEVGTFVPPTAPTRTVPDFVMPTAPADITVNIPTLDLSGVPALPAEPAFVTYSPPTRPNIDLPTAPDLEITLDSITLPTAPVFDLPDVPDFYSLNLPVPPTLDIPTFSEVAPTVDSIEIEEAPFVFNEQPYTSDMLDAIRAKVTVMLDGGPGLPAAAEQALVDRAIDREEQTTQKSVAEAYEEFVSRGWSEPSPMLFGQIDRRRQDGYNRVAQVNRDVYIQAQTVMVENLRFIVAQGIAMEQTMISLHLAVQERAFQAMRYAREVLFRVVDAKIARVNLDYQVFQAKAAVYRDRIQAELAKAEVYRTELEGQRLIGELNNQLVERYVAQLRGIEQMVQVYRVNLEAVNVQAQINTQRIEAAKARAQLYASEVDGYEAAWRGFAANVEGELGTVRMNEVAAQTYLGRINAWQTTNQVAIDRQRAEIDGEQLKIAKLDSLLRRYAADIEAERSRIDAAVRALAADAQVYSAAADVAQAQSATADRALQLQVERTRADADIQLRRGEIAINTTLQRSAQLLEALKAIGTIAAQLSASSMSAVNLSASISSGQSNSTSCGVGYNFSGDI